MASKPFQPGSWWERQYLTGLRKLLQAELDRIGRHGDTIEAIQELLQASHAKPVFTFLAEALARDVVTGVAAHNARSWRVAAAESQQGRRIYDLLAREAQNGTGARMASLVRENAQLIRSVPIKLAEQATAIIAKRQREGLRPGAIAKELRQRLPGMAESRIQLIARTEVAKAGYAVTSVRAESLGLTHFTWRTSEDGRVRRSHRLMDGVLIPFTDLPSPEALAGERSVGQYGPGGIYNCRCISIPLVNLQSLSWPRRVYINQSLERLSRAEFTRDYGRAAA